MDSIAFYFDFEDENVEKTRTRKEVRDKVPNVFKLNDKEFSKQFRLNKEAFNYVLEILKSKLQPNARSTGITPEIKLLALLSFFAKGRYQNSTGNDFNVGMAQSTVSIVFSEVLSILEKHLCPEWISLEMSEEEKQEAREYFYEKSKIPGIVMCVDGTHVRLSKPAGENAEPYLNSNGFYSLNIMLICDHKQRIRSIDAKHPGSSHDSTVWINSDASEYFKGLYESGERNVRLLGDSGYPLLPWLITPFRDVENNTPESQFNMYHSAGRDIVEQTIGLLKNWCRCLMTPHYYSPKKLAQIINVAAALHNIRLFYKVNDDYNDVCNLDDEPEIEYDEQCKSSRERYTLEANNIRNEILRKFNNEK